MDINPATLPREVIVGERFDWVLSNLTIGGVPWDVSTWSGKLVVRNQFNETDPPILTLVSPTDITMAVGQITVVILPTITAALTPGRYVYDLRLWNGQTGSTDDRAFITRGEFLVKGAATRG
jgi:hypothetical protein